MSNYKKVKAHDEVTVGDNTIVFGIKSAVVMNALLEIHQNTGKFPPKMEVEVKIKGKGHRNLKAKDIGNALLNRE